MSNNFRIYGLILDLKEFKKNYVEFYNIYKTARISEINLGDIVYFNEQDISKKMYDRDYGYQFSNRLHWFLKELGVDSLLVSSEIIVNDLGEEKYEAYFIIYYGYYTTCNSPFKKPDQEIINYWDSKLKYVKEKLPFITDEIGFKEIDLNDELKIRSL